VGAGQVARPGVDVHEGEGHPGGAGTVFHEHQVRGGIREGNPALQVDWHAVVRNLKRQCRDLLDTHERVRGVAPDARTGSEHGDRHQTSIETSRPFRR